MRSRVDVVRERVSDIPMRVRVIAELSVKSGLLWEIGRDALREIVRTLATGSQNPSQIYRIHAVNTPNKTALVWRDVSYTYGELNARIDQLANALLARGFGRGKSLLLMMKNRPEFIELGAAAARLGGAAVSVSWRSTAAELSYLANHSGAELLCFDAEVKEAVFGAKTEFSERLRANLVCVGSLVDGVESYASFFNQGAGRGTPPPASADDAAVVIYTSGTTGKPKGAVRKFPRDAIPQMLRFILQTPMRSSDVHLVVCPLYHSTAFAFMGLSQILGCTVVLLDEFKPEPFLNAVERYRATTTALVPTMLSRLMELPAEERARYNARSLRVVFTGGAQLPATLGLEFMDAFGDVLFNFYGATETGLVTLASPEDLRAAPGCIGKAVPGNDIRWMDESGREIETGVGELFVKNKLLVAGYHNDDGATRASMKDGFFSVGDLARRDRDGRYFIEGRKRDMVISGGVNVYPAEVEAVLESHPAVFEAAVVGVPDKDFGERVRAFVVRRSGADLDEAGIKAYVRERLSGAKVPRDFVFLDALPRNPTGKVLKRELRERQ